MKTHEDWIKLFKECRGLFEDGTNYVRLHLGEFKEDDRWGFLEVCCWSVKISEKITKFAKDNNLEMGFMGECAIRLEDKEQQSSK